MSTSCKRLAQLYAADPGGQPIPASTESAETRMDWLLTQTWGCILPGQTLADFHPADFSNPNDFCKQNNNAAKSPPPAEGKGGASNAMTRPPVYNYLKEDGFLHWVNQRGLQCVNRIVGNFYGLNTETGNANFPSVSVTPPDSQCWGSCFQVNSTSEICFQCVVDQLTVNPSQCPELDASNPATRQLIQDAVNCHECIGSQTTFIPLDASQPNVPNQTAIVDNMWKCITGQVNPPLSTADIVIIVVVCVFVAVIALTLGLYYGYFHPKILKREAQRHTLMEAGYNPDEL